MAIVGHTLILHQLGAKLQEAENQCAIILHQVGAKFMMDGE